MRDKLLFMVVIITLCFMPYIIEWFKVAQGAWYRPHLIFSALIIGLFVWRSHQ